MDIRSISLVVPVYNQAKTLPLLLRCLRAQRCRVPFEVLICDDGSADETWSILQREQELELRYIWQPDRSFRLARSRNNGIRAATGDLLVLLDGDVVVRPDFLETHLREHDGSPLIVSGPRCSIEASAQAAVIESADPIATLEAVRQPHPYDDQHRYLSGPFPWMALYACNFSVPRRLEVLFDELMVGWGTEDREFAYRMSRAGYRFAISQDLLCYHFAAPRAWTHDKLVEALRNKLYLKSLYPIDELAPAFDALNWWFLDPRTDRWSSGPYTKRPLAELVQTVEDWFVRNGVSWPRGRGAP